MNEQTPHNPTDPLEHRLDALGASLRDEPDGMFEQRLARALAKAEPAPGRWSIHHWLAMPAVRLAASVALVSAVGAGAWWGLNTRHAADPAALTLAALTEDIDHWLDMDLSLSSPFSTDLGALDAEARALDVFASDELAWWSDDWLTPEAARHGETG